MQVEATKVAADAEYALRHMATFSMCLAARVYNDMPFAESALRDPGSR
jgi:hypothetical protein